MRQTALKDFIVKYYDTEFNLLTKTVQDFTLKDLKAKLTKPFYFVKSKEDAIQKSEKLNRKGEQGFYILSVLRAGFPKKQRYKWQRSLK